jgi:hypothetical protein
MSVDFLSCENCNETFCDAGDFFRCECGATFCSSECGERKDGSDDLEENDDDDDCDQDEVEYDDTVTCLFCREEDAPSESLLGALLTHFNITRDDALKIHFAQEKKKKDE